jgi:hypothetical protein
VPRDTEGLFIPEIGADSIHLLTHTGASFVVTSCGPYPVDIEFKDWLWAYISAIDAMNEPRVLFAGPNGRGTSRYWCHAFRSMGVDQVIRHPSLCEYIYHVGSNPADFIAYHTKGTK